MIITIDGPTASGKSTLARILAGRLGFFYLSSGLLFRGLAYCLHKECNYSTTTIVQPKQQDIKHCVSNTELMYYKTDERGARLFLHDTDVTDELKTPLIDQLASIIATNPDIRYSLLHMQKRIADEKDVVVEGRDCGSVVFPQAELKFYVTAQPEIRALRWQKDQENKGNYFTLQEAVEQIELRDNRDSNRSIAPLVVPKGAYIIDNSHMSIAQTVELILDKKKERAYKTRSF